MKLRRSGRAHAHRACVSRARPTAAMRASLMYLAHLLVSLALCGTALGAPSVEQLQRSASPAAETVHKAWEPFWADLSAVQVRAIAHKGPQIRRVATRRGDRTGRRVLQQACVPLRSAAKTQPCGMLARTQRTQYSTRALFSGCSCAGRWHVCAGRCPSALSALRFHPHALPAAARIHEQSAGA